MTALMAHLAGFGDRPAVVTATEEVTYRQLAELVSRSAQSFGPERRLILLRARNELGTLIPYLGALAGRHVALPVPCDRDITAVIDTYRPDAVVDSDGTVTEVAPPAPHLLHDDLALLMSTSGSTGSPKLVRLSRENLVSNATAIAQYLDISEKDCAATTLPLSYCYGLSVVHSYLLRGARLILTDASVVDAQFWDLFDRYRGTSLAGVPYTFDLLDRIGFDDMDLPTLRYVTQAGGRLAPDRVQHFAALGAAKGWDFIVMYGATEATARMAYLPPQLAQSHPASIGRPIPGGEFHIEPVPGWTEPGTGELVYRGPNVMLGYAHRRADLALDRTVHELHTGDIARCGRDGLYEIVGRSARFVKLFGLRVDLQRVEGRLARHGIEARCTDSGDDRLLVAVDSTHDVPDVRTRAAAAAGVPTDAVIVVPMAQLPVLSSGKPDYAAVRQAVATACVATADPGVRRLYGDVLNVDPGAIDTDSTFIDLGGTSLNYVTTSVRLQRLLGQLPPNWHQVPVGRLERHAADDRTATKSAPRRQFSATDTSILLRAVAIVFIVGSHAGVFELWGGAHILLAVAGYNFGRFGLTSVSRPQRVRRLWATIGWIAVPSIAWIAAMLVVTDDYHLSNLLLANKILGPFDSMTAGRLWFIEVLVWSLITLTVLLTIPVVDRCERRSPILFAAAFLGAGVLLRFDVLGFDQGRQAWFTYLALWFFALGWVAAKAEHVWQRAAVTAVLAVCLYGYFDDGWREALVFTGIAVLIWLPSVRCPAPLALVAGVLADASLFTYLTHYQVYPLFDSHPVVGVLAALAVGVLITAALNRARRWRPRTTTAAPRRTWS